MHGLPTVQKQRRIKAGQESTLGQRGNAIYRSRDTSVLVLNSVTGRAALLGAHHSFMVQLQKMPHAIATKRTTCDSSRQRGRGYLSLRNRHHFLEQTRTKRTHVQTRTKALAIRPKNSSSLVKVFGKHSHKAASNDLQQNLHYGMPEASSCEQHRSKHSLVPFQEASAFNLPPRCRAWPIS